MQASNISATRITTVLPHGTDDELVWAQCCDAKTGLITLDKGFSARAMRSKLGSPILILLRIEASIESQVHAHLMDFFQKYPGPWTDLIVTIEATKYRIRNLASTNIIRFRPDETE